MKELLAVGGMILAASAGWAEVVWKVDGFDMPESAIVDTARDRIILSVIGGHPGEADGDGRLALLSRDGAVLDPLWIAGLDAPKGMAILGDTLLVADLTHLVEVDLATDTIIRRLEAPGAVFLNDITARGGVAYISDLMTHTLWRYEGGAVSPWLEDPQLSYPNGLLLDGDRLLVGSWGAGLHDDFSTDVPGSLLEISLETQAIRVLAPELGNIDGVARIGSSLFVSDWVTGNLFAISEDETVSVVGNYGPGLADISAEGGTLFLPMMLDGRLVAQAF